MTTDDPNLDGPEPDMMAAELALGLLEGDERAAALRRVLADPAFAREVEDWRERLTGLFDDYPEVAAPESVAARLEARDAPRQRSAWPVLALAMALAAAVALFFVAQPGPPPVPIPTAQPHAMMLAALAASDKRATTAPVSALVDTVTGEVRIAGTTLAPAGKAAQLWMIADDGVPHSIGVLDNAGPTRLKMAEKDRAALAAGVTLAVSIEPPGGSPKPTPTGPVVATGKLSIA